MCVAAVAAAAREGQKQEHEGYLPSIHTLLPFLRITRPYHLPDQARPGFSDDSHNNRRVKQRQRLKRIIFIFSLFVCLVIKEP